MARVFYAYVISILTGTCSGLGLRYNAIYKLLQLLLCLSRDKRQSKIWSTIPIVFVIAQRVTCLPTKFLAIIEIGRAQGNQPSEIILNGNIVDNYITFFLVTALIG